LNMERKNSVAMYIFTQQMHEFPHLPEYKSITSLADNNIGIDYKDNCGDNINEKNKSYAEYTKLYWIWKNAPKSDIVGFCQYRRYFWLDDVDDEMVQITKDTVAEAEPYLRTQSVSKLLQDYDILLTPLHVYTFDTVREQYGSAECTDYSHLEQLEKVIKKLSPEYYPACEQVLASHYCYTCDMFITRWAVFDAYMTWYFRICRELEKTIVVPEEPLKWRVYAFLGERMLDIFVLHHKLKYKGMPMIFINGKAEAGYSERKNEIRIDDLTYIYSLYGFNHVDEMPATCKQVMVALRHNLARLCQMHSHIYIYGAGLYGRLLNVLLAEHNRRADAFIVTHMQGNGSLTDGIKTISADNLPSIEQNGIIIIGIKDVATQKGISEKLHRDTAIHVVTYNELATWRGKE